MLHTDPTHHCSHWREVRKSREVPVLWLVEQPFCLSAFLSSYHYISAFSSLQLKVVQIYQLGQQWVNCTIGVSLCCYCCLRFASRCKAHSHCSEAVSPPGSEPKAHSHCSEAVSPPGSEPKAHSRYSEAVSLPGSKPKAHSHCSDAVSPPGSEPKTQPTGG